MKVRLLMLEDEENDAILVRESLRDYGLELDYVHLTDGKQLRETLAQSTWDVVTCDYRMPGMNAEEALEIVREHDSNLPFILVSGTVDAMIAVEMMRRGMHDFAMKDDLARLGPSVVREIREARLRSAADASRAEMEAAQRRFQETFEQSAVGIAHLDLDMKVVWSNQRMAEMLGYDVDQMMGVSCEQATWPEDLPAEKAIQKRLLAGEIDEYSVEKRYTHRDRHPVWGYLTLTAIKDDAGQISYFTAVVQDISAKKAAEEELLASRNFIRATIDSLPFEVTVTDRRGRVRMYNRQSGEREGVARASLEGLSVGDSYIEQASGEVRGELTELLAGTRRSLSHEYTRGEGEERRFYLMEAVSLETEEGGLVITHLDITARVEAERELSRRENEYRTIVNSMREGLVSLDERQRVRFVNPAFCEITGYTEQELLSNDLFELIIPEEDIPSMRAKAARRWKGITDVYEFEALRKDGERRVLRIHASPQYDADGTIIGGMAVMSDVSDIRRAEEEQNRLQHQLDELSRLESLGKLAGTMAHEFNNVLMGIQPFTEVIERAAAPDNDKIAKATRYISDAVQRGRRISQEVLRFARPQQPVRIPYDVSDLLEDIRDASWGALANDYQLELEADQDVAVSVDREQIIQVFANLVVNARDASEPGSAIRVVARVDPADSHYEFGVVSAPDRFVHLRVIDQGSGMKPELLRRVFEPMVTTKTNGTGLGLAVAHQIITSHDGYIFAESQVGQGTSVHVFLPIASQEQDLPVTGSLSRASAVSE